jgi:hypothetical protein
MKRILSVIITSVMAVGIMGAFSMEGNAATPEDLSGYIRGMIVRTGINLPTCTAPPCLLVQGESIAIITERPEELCGCVAKYDKYFFNDNFLVMFAIGVGIGPGIELQILSVCGTNDAMNIRIGLIWSPYGVMAAGQSWRVILEMDRALLGRDVSIEDVIQDYPRPAAPSAPTISGTPTANSITLNEIAGAEYRARVATSKFGDWQPSPIFSGLTADTDYIFQARFTASMIGSPASEISPDSAAIRTAFGVAPTGIPGITGAMMAMFAFMLFAVGLWGYIIRRRLIHGRNG